MRSKNGINVRLFGGLGNQLFQYFAGLDFARKSESSLVIDARWIEASYSQDESDIRDFRFLRNTSITTIRNSRELNFKIERMKTKFANSSRVAAKFLAINSPNNPGFAEFDDLKTDIELRGYYQSYKHFENVSRKFGGIDWSLVTESSLFLELKNMLNKTPFIALHIRGGDYLKSTNIYHKLDAKYYSDSLKELKDELKNMTIYVFSDDISYARKILKDFPELEFLDQEGLRASEAMVLMSLAKGIITANSTFSYWAAMINAGNHIYAPKFWYANTEADEYLYPPHWKII